MAQALTYEGTPEQLVRQLSKLPNTQKYKITVTPEEKDLLPSSEALRPIGLCAGEFVVPIDFDAPLPDAVLAEFEGA